MQQPWVPREMTLPPRLDPELRPGPVQPRHALLINPFYPKDPHASFGKHVLTPTLALTSFAGATPPTWTVRYWDENLLQGPPPAEPFPQVVAITVHLTFSGRVYELARWFRDRATDGLHMPYQCRDVEQVVNEVVADGQPYFVFTDNNLGSRPAYLRELCLALRPLERIWSAAVTLDVTDDPSLIRAMALAGCTGVFIGFESLADDNLAAARKKSPRTQDYARRVDILHEHGIQVNGSFVLGFDEDRPDVFARTAAWIEENRLECATFHILTPYPGTPLYRSMEAEGRLLHKNWDLYDTAHVVFRPRHMTPEQLAEGYAWCYHRLFSHRSIWRRRPADPHAVLPYLAMSYLYKRSNRLWHLLIRHRLTALVWRPLVECTRRRHVRFRRRLAAGASLTSQAQVGTVLTAGV